MDALKPRELTQPASAEPQLASRLEAFFPGLLRPEAACVSNVMVSVVGVR